jgi:hypothetical protein
MRIGQHCIYSTVQDSDDTKASVEPIALSLSGSPMLWKDKFIKHKQPELASPISFLASTSENLPGITHQNNEMLALSKLLLLLHLFHSCGNKIYNYITASYEKNEYKNNLTHGENG